MNKCIKQISIELRNTGCNSRNAKITTLAPGSLGPMTKSCMMENSERVSSVKIYQLLDFEP